MRQPIHRFGGSLARRCTAVLICVSVGSVLAAPARGLAGNYDITVSQGSFWDPKQPTPRFEGRLVLLSENLADDIVSSLGSRAYGHKLIEGRPNGCFALCTTRGWDGKRLPVPQVERELIHWS